MLEHRVSWAQLPGLRSRLVLSTLASCLPFSTFSLALGAVLFGNVGGWVSNGLSLAFVTAIQCALHIVGAAAFIVPVQRHSFHFFDWFTSNAWIGRKLPDVVAGLRPIYRQLQAMRDRLPHARAEWLRRAGVEQLHLLTPDGAVVDGLVVRATGTRRGCLIYLGGNGEHYELNQCTHTYTLAGFDVIVINYRGVGDSAGYLTRNGAIIDAACAISFAKFGLGVPANQIIVMGHSIGGAFGTEAARCFPDVFVINDRSFGSLSRVAVFTLARPFVLGPGADTTLALWIRYAVLMLVRHVACFELDTAEHWRHIPSNNKMIVYSVDDKIIPPPAQLATQLLESGTSHAEVGCLLSLDSGHGSADAHNSHFSTSEQRRVMEGIDRFLHRRPLPDKL